MGLLHYFLGIQVLRQSTGLVLSQKKYLEDLLRETNMLTSKPYASPMVTSPTLTKAMGSPYPHPEQYRQALGSLQYLTLTRPNIAFPVNKLAQFMHSPLMCTGKQSRGFLAIFVALLLLVLLSPTGLNFHFRHSQTVIGQAVWMTIDPLVVIWYIWVLILFHGPPRNNQPLLALPLNPNARLLVMSQSNMEQPTGFKHAQFPNHVCRLQRTLYGLKQAPRAWFKRLTDYLIQLGFTPSRVDASLFYLILGE
jgi:hypothetical protein